MMDSEDQRSEENASDSETDLEEEEVAETQSDGGLSDLAQKELGSRVSGRKRVHSETTGTSRQTFPGSLETKCSRQASNLHNEREKERRKDLKMAVHRLRNQLQLRKTKKATTISVLKASEQEIKDLLGIEDVQKRKLCDLQNRHKYLTWKLENLLAEQDKSGTATSKQPAPVISSPLPAGPSTSMSPILYMPPTPSAPRPVNVPGSLHSNPVEMQPQQTIPVSPPTFPFGPPVLSPFRYPNPCILSTIHQHPAFPIQPARPFFIMPSPTPLLPPSVLPCLPSGQVAGQFTFPPAPTPLSSHPLSPSSFFLHQGTQPGQQVSAASHFPIYLTQHSVDDSTTVPTDNPTTQTTESSYNEGVQSLQQQSSDASDNPLRLSHGIRPHTSSISQITQLDLLKPDSSLGENLQATSSNSQRRSSNSSDSTGDQVIDVVGTEHDHDSDPDRQPFLDVRFLHRKQRKRRAEKKKTVSVLFTNEQEMLEANENGRDNLKNWIEPPALVTQSNNRNFKSAISKIMKRVEPATKVITQDMFTSTLEKHRLFFESPTAKTTAAEHKEEERFCPWNNNVKQSPTVIDLTSHSHPPTVICP